MMPSLLMYTEEQTGGRSGKVGIFVFRLVNVFFFDVFQKFLRFCLIYTKYEQKNNESNIKIEKTTYVWHAPTGGGIPETKPLFYFLEGDRKALFYFLEGDRKALFYFLRLGRTFL